MSQKSGKPKMLVVAKTLPLHDRASGDYRLFQILSILAQDYEIDYLSTWHTVYQKAERRLDYVVRDASFNLEKVDLLDQKYIDDLKTIGVNPLNQALPVPFTPRPTNDYDARAFLAAKKYDAVWIEFFYVADQYLADIRRFQPWATVICDSVDLHFRRLARQYHYLDSQVKYLVNFRHEKKRPGARHQQKVIDHRNYADHVRENELKAYEKCDAVVVVSEDDRQELARHAPKLPLLFIPNIHRPAKSGLPPANLVGRQGCIFVGNFDHNPNVSSALYLKHEVAPQLTDPGIKFAIVGSNPPKVIRTMGEFGPEKERFRVTGYVPDTAPELARARVSVAPILFGAGMNGKIGEAIANGLPVVTTALGALGMGLIHEETCLVADDPGAFARAIERLHSDDALWLRIRDNAWNYLETAFTRDRLESSVRGELGRVVKPRAKSQALLPASPAEPIALHAPRFPKPPKHPRFSVVVLAYNLWPYTELCLRSLAHAEKQDPGLAEYILVDNNSADGTAALAGKIPNLRVIRNAANLGFAAGNNVGIQAARGENVVVLNNDTIVPPGWLQRFARHLDVIPNLGMLGPSTNTESGQALYGARYNSVAELFLYNERLGRDNLGAWELGKKISGLCMLLPRRTLELVGAFDEDYGIGYFEDDDLCLRTEDKGLKLVWAKDVYIHHFGSVSFEGNKLKRLQHLEEGMSRFAFKWGKRGLDHIAKAHQETLLRLRKPKSTRW